MIKRIKIDFSKSLALFTLIIITVFFSVFGNNFFSTNALVNILDSSYYIGFLGIGVTFAILTGGIDLSIGAVMMCSALVGGVAYQSWGLPMQIALLLVVVTGVVFGFLNGLLVAKAKIVPFVATLGTQMIALGFGAIVSKVTTMRYPAVGSEDAWFKSVFYKAPNGFPIGVIWLFLFFLLAYIVLTKTILGRYTYAIGSNEEAVRLSGVNVDFWIIAIYAIVGLFSGLAGIMYAAAYTSIIPLTGAGMEILGIAGVVIGGASLSGGIGKISGTIIGVYIMSVLKQGLMSMNLQGHYQTFFTGIVVIAAVMLDGYRTRKSRQ